MTTPDLAQAIKIFMSDNLRVVGEDEGDQFAVKTEDFANDLAAVLYKQLAAHIRGALIKELEKIGHDAVITGSYRKSVADRLAAPLKEADNG